MFNIKLSALILLTVCMMGTNSQAQEKAIRNIATVELRNSGTIDKNDKVSGYYFFYKAEPVGKGDYSYRLEIFDENLEMVGKQRITATKYLYLLEAEYNGDALAFKFYDAKEKEVSLKFYDEAAEKLRTDSYEPDRIEKQAITMAAAQGTTTDPAVIAVEGAGFIHVTPVKLDNRGYVLEFYPNNKEAKGWKYKSKSNADMHEFVSNLEANEHIILNNVLQKKNLMTKDVNSIIIGLDPKSGEELFSRELEDSRYSIMIMNSDFNEKNNNINLYGYYFEKGDKEMAGQSLGLVLITMNPSGEIESKKFVSWNKDVAKYLPVDLKGKIDEIGYIFFHRFVQKEDGSIYAIGEQYKKTVSAAGMASQVLSGGRSGSSAFQITVEDFYIFEFDPEFNLKDVKVFDKSITRVALPAGAGYYGPQFLAYYINYMGGFDYSYSELVDGGETFIVGYTDFEKRKKEKNSVIFGTIAHTGSDYTTDKIDTATEADEVKVLQAEPGKVLFVEYFQKDKKLDMHFEKINY